MEKAITLALAFSLSIAVSTSWAQSGSGPEWVTGKITSIYEDEDGALMSLEMADGRPYNVSVTNEMLKGLSAGDVVTVRIVKGWAELIEKADINPPATPEPDKNKTGPQWVAGTLVSVEEGPEDSLLSIKLSNDKVFNVSASNDKIEGIKPDDYVTVKIQKGWAQLVTKK